METACMRRLLFLMVWMLVTLFAYSEEEAPALWMGMTREQLYEVIGYPSSHATAGNRTILLYKSGLRFELENNRLVSVQNYPGRFESTKPPPPPPKSSKIQSAPGPKIPPQAALGGPEFEKASLFDRNDSLPNYKSITQPALNQAQLLADFFKKVYAPELLGVSRTVEPLGVLLLVALTRVLFTFLALQFASRWFGHDTPLRDLLAVSLAEMMLRILVATLGVLVMKNGFHAWICELITLFSLLPILKWRFRYRTWLHSFLVTFAAKIAVLGVAFVCFLFLLNLNI